MELKISFKGASLSDIAKQTKVLAERALTDGVTELNQGGAALRAGMTDVLAGQTGLPKRTIDRFLHERTATNGSPVYELRGTGGNVSLKYFGARETRAGVSAAPWGTRHIFDGTFIKAGWWPHRVVKPKWNGQVFKRTGGTTSTGKDEFEKIKSGLFIASEMVKGASATYFEQSAERLGIALIRAFEAKVP